MKPRIYKLSREQTDDEWRWRLHCPFYDEEYEYKSWDDALAGAEDCVIQGVSGHGEGY